MKEAKAEMEAELAEDAALLGIKSKASKPLSSSAAVDAGGDGDTEMVDMVCSQLVHPSSAHSLQSTLLPKCQAGSCLVHSYLSGMLSPPNYPDCYELHDVTCCLAGWLLNPGTRRPRQSSAPVSGQGQLECLDPEWIRGCCACQRSPP
jgi:hypothetical protein